MLHQIHPSCNPKVPPSFDFRILFRHKTMIRLSASISGIGAIGGAPFWTLLWRFYLPPSLSSVFADECQGCVLARCNVFAQCAIRPVLSFSHGFDIVRQLTFTESTCSLLGCGNLDSWTHAATCRRRFQQFFSSVHHCPVCQLALGQGSGSSLCSKMPNRGPSNTIISHFSEPT